MKKSAIIIGGGLGGLFTGAILSKEGLDVTVVEKNTTVGGGLQTFVRFGESFDTGMHVIGGMQEGGNIRKICKYLGILDKIHIKDVDADCIDRLYFAEDKKEYKIAKGRKNFVESLASYFPDQKDNLTRYVDAMFRITEELDLFYLRPTKNDIFMHSEDFIKSADAFIAQYITDERLQHIVAYMNPLYSGRGDMTPAFVHAIISVLYINGPSRFAGGSGLFAEVLKNLIIDNGGKVYVNEAVETIVTEDKNIKSIVTAKGRELVADYYISAIHPCTMLKMLDNPKVFPKSYRTRLEEVPNSYSAFTLNIKLKPNTFKYFNYTAYYMSKYNEIWNFGRTDNQWPLGFLYMTPPEIEQGEYSTKLIVTAPMAWEYVKKWENTTVGHRGEEYEAWKKECCEKLLDMMEEVHPGIRDCIDKINTASPLTIRDYYGVKEGGMCGFSKDYKNIILSQVPVVTKIPNLLLTGQCNNLHGFCGVPLTAIVTSEVILGMNYVINKINEL
ncbi:MAG: NAD(P)/FAD-dependent oxidoreductase [Bacteroidaceae bacterium]|nr:NAD(P)/FAD-dependent oxidoreductase [Bacteroidaceae bacterium]